MVIYYEDDEKIDEIRYKIEDPSSLEPLPPMERSPELEEWSRISKEEDLKTKQAFDQIMKIIEENFPKKEYNVHAPDYFWKIFDWFGEFFLEVALCKYISNKVSKIVEHVDTVYDLLVEGGHTEDNKYNYNDLDNDLFYLPCKRQPSRKVFALCTQSLNFLFVRDRYEKSYYGPDSYLRIFRYWDHIDADDEYHSDVAKKAIEEGRYEHFAVLKADEYERRYTDDMDGVEWIHRPSLDYFKRHSFLKGENVYSFDALYALNDISEHRGRTIDNFYMINRALFEIGHVVERMTEEQE